VDQDVGGRVAHGLVGQECVEHLDKMHLVGEREGKVVQVQEAEISVSLKRVASESQPATQASVAPKVTLERATKHERTLASKALGREQ
jgi:hypothetical protein